MSADVASVDRSPASIGAGFADRLGQGFEEFVQFGGEGRGERGEVADGEVAEVGVKHEFITVTGAGHGLSGAKPDKVAEIAWQAAEFIRMHVG